MVIDVPKGSRGEALSLGRYYPIIIETDSEEAEINRFINAPRAGPVIPDLLDRRPSQLWSNNVLISRYEAPAEGWPWLCVVRWPDFFREAAGDRGVDMARGCYTIELFADLSDLDAHLVALLDGLGSHHEISVRLLSAEHIGAAGSA